MSFKKILPILLISLLFFLPISASAQSKLTKKPISKVIKPISKVIKPIIGRISKVKKPICNSIERLITRPKFMPITPKPILIFEPITVFSPVPDDIVKKYNLDTTYYQKYADANGIPVLSSSKVRDGEIIEAVKTITPLLKQHPEIQNALVNGNNRVVLLAGPRQAGEPTNGIPELSSVESGSWYAYINGIMIAPAELKPEKTGFNVLMHEFAHAADIGALSVLYPNFSNELEALYQQEIATKFTGEYYTRTNRHEFWAGIVSAYYNDPHANYANLTSDFATYAPDSYNFVDKYFGADFSVRNALLK